MGDSIIIKALCENFGRLVMFSGYRFIQVLAVQLNRVTLYNILVNQKRMHELNFCVVVPRRSESTIKHALATGEAKAGCWMHFHLERC